VTFFGDGWVKGSDLHQPVAIERSPVSGLGFDLAELGLRVEQENLLRSPVIMSVPRKCQY